MNYSTLIEKIKEGYVIRPQFYAKENVTVYSLVKHLSDTERTVYAEIARNIAMKLKKEAGAIIEQPVNMYACNFIPLEVKPNCIRFECSKEC